MGRYGFWYADAQKARADQLEADNRGLKDRVKALEEQARALRIQIEIRDNEIRQLWAKLREENGR